MLVASLCVVVGLFVSCIQGILKGYRRGTQGILKGYLRYTEGILKRYGRDIEGTPGELLGPPRASPGSSWGALKRSSLLVTFLP